MDAGDELDGLQQANGTLLNYIDQTQEYSWADTSGTALLAATSFRHAVFTNSTKHVDAANRAYTLIEKSVDENGVLHGTIDPMTFVAPTAGGSVSPEGQSFVLMLRAARDAWLEAMSS